jgi:hypothetical protein
MGFVQNSRVIIGQKYKDESKATLSPCISCIELWGKLAVIGCEGERGP